MKKLLALFLLASSVFAQQQVQPVAGVLTLNLVPGTTAFKVILSSNVTSVVIVNPTPGTIISVIFTENATGGFTVAFGGNIASPCTITTTANATTICQFQYDSTNNQWTGIGGGGGNIPNTPGGSLQAGPLTYSASNYGVKADAVEVIDASWTNMQNTVTCPNNDCNFVASTDNGKTCWGNSNLGQNHIPRGTLTVTGAQSATCATATGTQTATGQFVWGTNDTAAWLALNAAYYASQRAAFIEGPGGHTIITAPPLLDPRPNTTNAVTWATAFQSPSGMTIFMPSPDFDFTKCGTVAGGDGGCLWDTNPTGGTSQQNLPQYQKLQNFGVDGSNLLACTGSASKTLLAFRRVEGSNIWLWNWCTQNAETGVKLTAPSSFYNLNANNFGGTSLSTVGGGNNSITFLMTSYVGGGSSSTLVGINAGSNVVSKGSYWLGCATQCIVVQSGGNMTMDGDQLQGASGNQYVDVAGNLWMINNVQMNATNASGHAILTRSGGKAFVQNSTIKETGANGIAFNVNLVPGGTIINGGGNSITGTDQTALAASMIVLSAGWGTTATVTALTGTPSSEPTRFSFQVNSSGTGQAANPTMAFTYPNVGSTPTWTCKQVGGTGALTTISGEGTATSTTMTLTFNGTPVAGLTYIITCTGGLQ